MSASSLTTLRQLPVPYTILPLYYFLSGLACFCLLQALRLNPLVKSASSPAAGPVRAILYPFTAAVAMKVLDHLFQSSSFPVNCKTLMVLILLSVILSLLSIDVLKRVKKSTELEPQLNYYSDSLLSNSAKALSFSPQSQYTFCYSTNQESEL